VFGFEMKGGRKNNNKTKNGAVENGFEE